jgi:enoyl-CoA hydratase
MIGEYEHLEIELEDGVLEVRMDRPDELNAITPELDAELQEVFGERVDDSEARVAVLTGRGDAFSAGGDLDWAREAVDNPEMFRESLYDSEKFIKDMLNLDTPTIAKINGDAVGGGMMLFLYCDLAYAADDAKFSDGHIPIGLSAGDGGVPVWPFYTNIRKAKEYMLTGDYMPAPEAAELGLINEAVPADQLDDRVDTVARKIADGPQQAITYTKKSLNTWLEFGVNLTLRESMALELLTQQHEDHAAALDAFLEGNDVEFPSTATDPE